MLSLLSDDTLGFRLCASPFGLYRDEMKAGRLPALRLLSSGRERGLGVSEKGVVNRRHACRDSTIQPTFYAVGFMCVHQSVCLLERHFQPLPSRAKMACASDRALALRVLTGPTPPLLCPKTGGVIQLKSNGTQILQD